MGIPPTDSSRSVHASVNMLQQIYCVPCSHRLLHNSYDCHTAKKPVSYFAAETGQDNIYSAVKP